MFANFIFKQLPSHIKLKYSHGMKKKGKSKEGESELGNETMNGVSNGNCLATLDIFAGCGGLSEGLQQSGNFYFICNFTLFLDA